jgi:diguanylate cyclase (GGDEF)-like protein
MANMQRRRRTDISANLDRRRSSPDRRQAQGQAASVRFPSFHEQAIQFLTRYLFALLGLAFFNFSADFAPRGLTLWQINTVFGIYLLINSINFLHASWHPISVARYRVSLWQDVVMVSICVASDPNDIPPSLVAYIVVVLGNGMRYGMRFFAEAIIGTVIGGAISITVRYVDVSNVLTPGTVFLCLFGVIIVVYAYILMGRVERARHRTEHVSRTDPLTGLLNRRGLSDAAAGWLAHARWSERRLVVMFADLDHFKAVNDRFGHAEGDRVLVKVADLLLESTRDVDFVVRYGGDEFVLLLTDTDLTAAEVIAQRIQSIIEGWMRNNNLNCGISIGVSEAPPGELNLEYVLQSVDQLLYAAKHKRHGETGRFESLATGQIKFE